MEKGTPQPLFTLQILDTETNAGQDDQPMVTLVCQAPQEAQVVVEPEASSPKVLSKDRPKTLMCDLCPPGTDKKFRYAREVHNHVRTHHPMDYPHVWLHYILCAKNLLKLHTVVSTEDKKGVRTVTVTCPMCRKFIFNAKYPRPQMGLKWKNCATCKGFVEPLENHLWGCPLRMVSKRGKSPREFHHKCSGCSFSFLKVNMMTDHQKAAHASEDLEAQTAIDKANLDQIGVKLTRLKSSSKVKISMVPPSSKR